MSSARLARRDPVARAARGLGLPARLVTAVAAAAGGLEAAAPGRPVVACDLDRTILYSAAALRLGPRPHPDLVVAEVYQGAPLSYWTSDARRVLVALGRAATFVPATTRTPAQLARVQVPGPPRYAVAANGGRLLVDGVACRDWDAQVAALLGACAPLAEVVDHLTHVADGPWVRKRRVADDLFAYLVVERDAVPAGFVADLDAWARQRGWGLSVQGRKVYLVPAPLTKSAAVAEVARRTGASRVLAAGDSLLDVDLLELAAVGLRPRHGELHDASWHAPHVSVTERAGVRAGEEILVRLLALTLASRDG